MKFLRLMVLSLSVCSASAVWATEHEGGSEQVNDRISSDLEGLAGSADNADALLEGLRSGDEFTLSEERDDGMGGIETISVDIDPSTDGMGYGGVSIAGALAEKLLSDADLESSPENIAAVLEGGEILDADDNVLASFSGILVDRADGMGWGEMANAAGFRLGELMSDLHSARDSMPEKANSHADARMASADRAQFDRPDRPVRPDRPERPERPDRPERPERPEKPDRPGRN